MFKPDWKTKKYLVSMLVESDAPEYLLNDRQIWDTDLYKDYRGSYQIRCKLLKINKVENREGFKIG